MRSDRLFFVVVVVVVVFFLQYFLRICMFRAQTVL